MAAFAGIDWGGAHHQAAVVGNLGRELASQRFAHDRAGIDGLVGLLVDHEQLAGVAIERSGGLLVERLHSAGIAVFAVSPRVSAAARGRHQAAARKSDRFDAEPTAQPHTAHRRHHVGPADAPLHTLPPPQPSRQQESASCIFCATR